jgi:aminoglycoside 2'-N-acetyltransferase I
VTKVQTAHTAELDAATLDAARLMLIEAFDGDWTDEDWDHARGGVHALAWHGPELVGHGAVVLRRLLHGGRALRAGYVEGVAVKADRRGQGYGAALMGALERVITRGYEVGALSASEDGARLYLTRGWRRWGGKTFALTPNGIQPTPDEDGTVYVFPVTAALDLGGELTCDWRDGEVW